jgi:hypothetical protein
MSPRDALLCAKNAREKVSPSPAQLHALLDWSNAWAARVAEPPFSDTWEELAIIAYRHLAKAQSTPDATDNTASP